MSFLCAARVRINIDMTAMMNGLKWSDATVNTALLLDPSTNGHAQCRIVSTKSLIHLTHQQLVKKHES